MKKVTIRDIAKELDLDISTVSRAINNSPRVKIKTRLLVQECAERIGYQVNRMASGLRKGKSSIIGIIVPKVKRSFFSKAISGMENVARKKGYHVIICQSKEKFSREVDSLKALMNMQVDGVIISVSTQTKEYAFFHKYAKRIPIVFFDRVVEEMDCDKIILNDFEGAYLATKHLIESGRKRIIHLGGPNHINIYRNRKSGYLETLKDFKIPVDKKLFFDDSITKSKGFKTILKLLEKGIAFDAIYASSDMAALGAIKALESFGMKIPQDVMVVGSGNEPFSSLTNPTLSTIDKHGQEMGKKSAEILIQRIENPEMKVKKIVLEPKLIQRESSSIEELTA